MAVVRLCGYTLSRIAWDLVNIHLALDRELNKMTRGGGYDEARLREAVQRLENLKDIVGFAYPACPVLRLDDVNSLKFDLVRAASRVGEALGKGVEDEVYLALLEATPETGTFFLKLYNYFIEK